MKGKNAVSTQRNGVTKKDLQAFRDEIIQHFHVISEDVISQVKQVAEGVANVGEKLDRRFNELKTKLEPAEPGLYKFGETRFMLTTEISSIYSKGNKVRKIHNLIFAPSIETVEKIREV
jgi:hypothetical protein